MHFELLTLGKGLGLSGVLGAHVLVEGSGITELFAGTVAELAYEVLALGACMLKLVMNAQGTASAVATGLLIFSTHAKTTAFALAAVVLADPVSANRATSASAAEMLLGPMDAEVLGRTLAAIAFMLAVQALDSRHRGSEL